ncbi:hypothetical protein [Dongia deserti]|uniref:hypothetical protein n=1 Tax=Dongia deserti TaxID=2268030 RepID=UPI0013C490A8|nr:hypothetical protein [Dongia deserti]
MAELTRRERKKRREAFLQEHPFCCFCGGTAKTTTEDHIPARAIWDGRVWPEGYAFPACGHCNDATRTDELIISLLSRMYPDPATPQAREEMRKAMRGVSNNVPGLLEAMAQSAQQLREAAHHGVALHDGNTLEGLPMISLQDQRIHDAVTAYGTKLGCALHYLHTGRIIPATGEIISRWFSNLDAIEGKIPESAFHLAREIPELHRGNRQLHDQFSYGFAITDDARLGFYLTTFRQSFAIAIGVSTESGGLFEEIDEVQHPLHGQ